MNEYHLYDRDLSWLSFNYRVLMEAKDAHVPTLERLRFAAIYSSNLDEFFRVRVAALRKLASVDKKKINQKLDFEPVRVLKNIHQSVGTQLQEYGQALDDILQRLGTEGILIHRDDITENHIPELERYFKTRALTFLQPQFITPKNVPFLKNRELYLGIRLERKGEKAVAVLNIPSDQLPRFYTIMEAGVIHYYFLDDIIRQFLHRVFPYHEILECRSIKLNKDADLQIDDEYSGDLVAKIEKQIKKRDLGEPSRFLFDSRCSDGLLETFRICYGLDRDDLSAGGVYHNLNDLFQVSSHGKSFLEYSPMPPIRNRQIEAHHTIFEAIDDHDQVLHFPYQPYDYILQFFNEAAIHPDVKEINVTFYRMAEHSIIANALISAARNGKIVNAFMEVKARFDEENNLRWAQQMREAGINVQYSMPGLKVHAKVALIRMKSAGKTRFYGFFGTGNLNEGTAKVYGDHGLLTGHVQMTRELNQVFKYLLHRQTPKPFKHLLVSQFGALEHFLLLMEREIAEAKAGREARIIVKVNNLEEPNLIRKLYEAAASGVEVKIIARSICCLVPETCGIEVFRLVDRYLEHARLFCFHQAGTNQLYLGSSDWMNRNLHHRIEVTFPIHDPQIRKQLLHVLDLQLNDNTKCVSLSPSMENIPRGPRANAPEVNAQRNLYQAIQAWQNIP